MIINLITIINWAFHKDLKTKKRFLWSLMFSICLFFSFERSFVFSKLLIGRHLSVISDLRESGEKLNRKKAKEKEKTTTKEKKTITKKQKKKRKQTNETLQNTLAYREIIYRRKYNADASECDANRMDRCCWIRRHVSVGERGKEIIQPWHSCAAVAVTAMLNRFSNLSGKSEQSLNIYD